jgi:hypothetical protein
MVEFPSKKETILAQKSAVQEYSEASNSSRLFVEMNPSLQLEAGGLMMMNHALFIPERAVELLLRLCVEAHCLFTGLRALETMLGAIKESFVWITTAQDVFCRPDQWVVVVISMIAIV